MKQYCRVGYACLLLLFAGAPGLSGQSADEVPLLEAVLRYEIDVFLKGSRTNPLAVLPSAFCVYIRATTQAEPADAHARLLARFKDHRPPVKPGSGCELKDWKVSDRSTGNAAAILDFGPVRRRGASRAEVFGAPYVGGQVARENLYRLKLTGKTWTVYDVEVKLVS